MPRRAAAAQPLPYTFDGVPDCEKRPPLRSSCAEAPSSRARWAAIKDEMKGLCDEAVKRRALKLLRGGARQRSALASAGAPLYEAYIADRLDLDDPLEGLVVRHARTGWLQGFLTYTTFTTWTPHFAWDSQHHASGLKGLVGSGRKLDAGVGRPPAAACISPRVGGAGANRPRACKPVAAGGEMGADLAEPLADALEREARSGDWRSTGIVWPRVAEISLLAAMGCGDWLVSCVLAQLARDDAYEYCVVCATPGAATFYERHGFVRVGAIARYIDPERSAPQSSKKGKRKSAGGGGGAAASSSSAPDSPDDRPVKPWQAYRHWAWGDERRESLRDNHGEPSYMMARRVRPHSGDALKAANALLRQRDARLALRTPRLAPSTKKPSAPHPLFAPVIAPTAAPPPPPRAANVHVHGRPPGRAAARDAIAAIAASAPVPGKKPASHKKKPAAAAAKPAARGGRGAKRPATKPAAKPAAKKPRVAEAKPPRRAAALLAKEALKVSAARSRVRRACPPSSSR